VTTLQRGAHGGDTCQNAVYYENSKLKREEEEEASLFDTSTKLHGGLLSESVALIRSEVWKRGSSQVIFYQNCHITPPLEKSLPSSVEVIVYYR